VTQPARLARVLAGGFIAVLVVLASAGPAAAHADLVGSDPPSGTVAAAAPGSVRLRFTEPVDPAFTRILIRGAAGRSYPASTVALDRSDNSALVIGMPGGLTDGPYAVTWTTTTTDGHTASGDVLFTVGEAVAGTLGPAQPVGEGPWLRRAATASRAVWFFGLAVFAGALLWRWGRKRPLVAGAWILATATLLRVIILLRSLASAGGADLATVLERLRPTTAGRAWFVLVDAAVVLVILMRRRSRRGLIAWLAVVLVAEAATGHAAVSPHPWITVPALAVHLGALAIWLGGLVLLLTVRTLDDARVYLRRFSPIALMSVGAVFLTGAVLALVEVGSWRGLDTTYGHTLLVKLGLVTAVALLGAWHWRTGARAALWLTARFEVALALAVLVAASILAGGVPGRVATATAKLAASSRPTTARACIDAPIETASCWEQYFRYAATKRGVPKTIAEIRRTAAHDEIVKSECHQLTHTVGRTAYELFQSADRALEYTTPLCNSGYQHGVIEEAIARMTPDQLRVAVPNFCQPGVAYRAYSFDHHNCTHGIGHGIATHLKEDVFASTPYCEVLGDAWEVQSCYGGVFMQKVIGDINGASSDEHTSDPVWPCDVVPLIQKGACYLISTGRVLRMVDYDWDKAFAVCDGVEADFVITCYESMGRDIAGFTNFEPVASRDLCLHAGKLGPEACFRGAAETTVDNDHDAVRATKLCDALAADFKLQCLAVVKDAAAQL
jgi:copper transport protein